MRKVSKIIIICMLITITLSTIFFLNKSEDKKIYQEKPKENKFLTLMIEKEAGTGKYEESSNSIFSNDGYYFNEKLSKCENGSKIKYNEKDKTIDVYTTKSDKCYAYFDVDKLGSICREENMAECFTKNYKKDGAIIYHDGKADYVEEENYELEAGDFSYRYTGTDEEVHNYICFDSEEESCPNDNLYRIIGLFKNLNDKYEVKLIKANYANKNALGENGGYVGNLNNNESVYLWNPKVYDLNWANSELCTQNLNLNFYNSISADWQKIISKSIWYVNITSNEALRKVDAKTLYKNEIIDGQDKSKTYENYIGLMYVNDYAYSAKTSLWKKSVEQYENQQENTWLCNNITELTITAATWGGCFRLYNTGYLGGVPVNLIEGYTETHLINRVRPVFYLTTSVKLANGAGTKKNPYRILI